MFLYERRKDEIIHLVELQTQLLQRNQISVGKLFKNDTSDDLLLSIQETIGLNWNGQQVINQKLAKKYQGIVGLTQMTYDLNQLILRRVEGLLEPEEKDELLDQVREVLKK